MANSGWRVADSEWRYWGVGETMQRWAFMWGIYWRLVGIQIRAQLQYRTAFVLEMLATGITLFLFFMSIAFVLQRFGTLGGWRLGEIAFLWGTVEFAFGLMDMIFSGFDPANFGKQVRQGLFDQLLLRPVNITMQVMGSEFVLRRLGRIAQGATIFTFALVLADIQWSVGKILYLPLVIVGLVCFFGGLFIVGATLSFWTVESLEAINILTYGGSEMMAYPMHIYPDWLRRTFTYVLPAIFLNYYPALYFLDKPDPLGLPPVLSFVSPLVGLGVLGGALLFWRFGIQHYQSTGT
ncbi:MAG: ABC-2 family transporter protein [Caldilineaceae bacterium]